MRKNYYGWNFGSSFHFRDQVAELTVEVCHFTDTSQICKIFFVGKVIASMYWDSEVVLNNWRLGMKTHCDSVYYAELIKKLFAVVTEKCQAKLHQDMLLDHDSARAHMHHCHGHHLRMQIRTAATPAVFYRPASHDFHLFQSLNDSLCGQAFKSDKNVVCVKKTLG